MALLSASFHDCVTVLVRVKNCIPAGEWVGCRLPENYCMQASMKRLLAWVLRWSGM